MQLEKQVCSLGLAKRLKELGVKQESVFYWMEATSGTMGIWLPVLRGDAGDISLCVSAFTVAELGEMFPKSRVIFSMSGFHEGAWSCELSTGNEKEHREYAETEADARAKILIYLLENRFIQSPEGRQ
jgi:hypothetical protein